MNILTHFWHIVIYEQQTQEIQQPLQMGSAVLCALSGRHDGER